MNTAATAQRHSPEHRLVPVHVAPEARHGALVGAASAVTLSIRQVAVETAPTNIQPAALPADPADVLRFCFFGETRPMNLFAT